VTRPATSPLDRKLLAVVRSLLGQIPVALALGDTENLPDTDTPIVGTVRIADRSALMSMALNPEVGFGDAYSAGKIEMDGDLVASLEYVCRSSPRVRNWSWRMLSKWYDWAQANTRRGSSRNIQHHYDLSNDFYRLWLDERMVYTCAYFPTPEASLDEAQEEKLDLVCRKLCLRPGESVIEVGCGWGALAIYMAQHYGVQVKAFNISHEQIVWARECAKKAGVATRVGDGVTSAAAGSNRESSGVPQAWQALGGWGSGSLGLGGVSVAGAGCSRPRASARACPGTCPGPPLAWSP